MTYSTLMVHLDLFHPNDATLKIAGDLAERFGSHVIGIAASNPRPDYYTNNSFARKLVVEQRKVIQQALAETEERFRAALNGRAKAIEWRSALSRPMSYVSAECRAADLIVAGTDPTGGLSDPQRQMDLGALVIGAGRPVFVVPPTVEWLNLKNALVAWRDVPEARRAVRDALPLLREAKEITVLEMISSEADRAQAEHRVHDVAGWLGRHGLTAFGQVLHAQDEAEELDRLWAWQADFVVAGAYGHSRLREWALGGVTRNLLTRTRRCSLLAH